MSGETILLLTAISLNLIATVINTIQAIRSRRMRTRIWGDHARLIAFAAFMSHPSSGAPETVRTLARHALPAGVDVEAIPEPPPSGQVH